MDNLVSIPECDWPLFVPDDDATPVLALYLPRVIIDIIDEYLTVWFMSRAMSNTHSILYVTQDQRLVCNRNNVTKCIPLPFPCRRLFTDKSGSVFLDTSRGRYWFWYDIEKRKHNYIWMRVPLLDLMMVHSSFFETTLLEMGNICIQ